LLFSPKIYKNRYIFGDILLMKLKILTFNWHEPYLCLLSRLKHDFLIVEPEIAPNHYRRWDQNMRSIPKNFSLISMVKANEMLMEGEIDCIIAHNVKDLINVKGYSLPKILVFHNCLSTEIKLSKNKVNREEYLEKIEPLLANTTKVFISEFKKTDWGMKGHIILPGLDVSEYGGYTGNNEFVLRVGNMLKERDLMMGYSVSEKIAGEHPLLTLGLNPGIPKSRMSKGFDDLLMAFRNNRVYLNTTVDGYEDGYNLAMLEAMAVGMPVVSTFNKSSPIVDGVNGFCSDDPAFLNDCIGLLMKDSVLSERLGRNARQTVTQKFPMSKFKKSWTDVIELAIKDFLVNTGINLEKEEKKFDEKEKKNILMDFVSYPPTTAYYFERALRQNHNVITCGDMINDEVKKIWNLEALKWEVKQQDIKRTNSCKLKGVVANLPKGWNLDLYLWIETGLGDIPIDLQDFDFLKVCYLIDTHINFDKHLELAKNFNFVFLAQKAYVEKMKKEGINNVYWLPLACDPDIHGQIGEEKKWDVGFVGTISDNNNRRKQLLEKIGSHFNLNCDRKFMDEMALHYSQSKVVFNNAINNDLNMRVFEALCSGSMLITDNPEGSGLEEMFDNKKHLVLYKDESIEEQIAYYLKNNKERQEIAQQGRREVLKKHTYLHRVIEFMNILNTQLSSKQNINCNSSKPDNYYKNVRYDLLPLVPEDAKCILEVGCAEGMTGKELKKRPGLFVAGIELNKDAAELARSELDDVVVGNIEEIDIPYNESSFDCVIFADVLEHLVDPLAALKKTNKVLKNDGSIIMSIPNVQFYGVVHQLVEGNWTYQKEGILDETHLRFFTLKEIEKLIEDAGLYVKRIEETLDPKYKDLQSDDHNSIKLGRLSINNLTAEEIRRFFVFQYRIIAGKVCSKNQIESLNEINIDKIMSVALSDYENGEYGTALGKYEKVLNINPACAEALSGIGNCYMKLQNPDKAEASFIKARVHDPDNYKAWLGLGLLELYRDNKKEAEFNLKRVIEINPKSDKAYCALGILNSNTGNLVGAECKFCQALDINIENLTAIQLLIDLSYKTKRYDPVYEYLKRFVDIYPTNLNMLFALAGILFKMGKTDASLQILDDVLALDPKHQYALEFQNSVRAVSAK